MKRSSNLGVSVLAVLMGSALLPLAGCASTMIEAKESLGYAKRDQLVDKVEQTRDSQDGAKKQFESALAEFLAVTGTGGSAQTKDLEARYAKLKTEFDRCEDRAETFRSRIKETERVSSALFNEWNRELDQYSSADLRRVSEQQLEETRSQYARLIGAMKASASKMDPVLASFKDQVLFLKHNLNARAISALQTQADRLETDVNQLVKEMEASIAEANAFIQQMQNQKS